MLRRQIRRIDDYLCLDISSTATGAVYKAARMAPVWELFACKDKDPLARIHNMTDMIKYWVKRVRSYNVQYTERLHVLVETPFYSPGKSHDLPIKMAHGAIFYALSDFLPVISWNYVHVSTWRSKILPKKVKMTKEEKKAWVLQKMAEHYNMEITDDNVGDAFGILHWKENYT